MKKSGKRTNISEKHFIKESSTFWKQLISKQEYKKIENKTSNKIVISCVKSSLEIIENIEEATD